MLDWLDVFVVFNCRDTPLEIRGVYGRRRFVVRKRGHRILAACCFSGLLNISLNVFGGGLEVILLIMVRDKTGELGQTFFRFLHEKDRISPEAH